MRVVTLGERALNELRGGAIALGNFDGLHAGHVAVVGAAGELARRSQAPWIFGTFDPTPRDLFAPDQPAGRIHTPLQREKGVEALGADACLLIPFTRELADLSDEAFVEQVLVQQLGAIGVAVGFDFRFGRNRMGSAERLAELGERHGFEVAIVPAVVDTLGKLSSTRIREAIGLGRMEEASDLLGAPWVVDAIVEHGEKRGRTLGFPTANMRLGGLIEPPFGVYAVWARLVGDVNWSPGVASFGRTPTTGIRDPLLEVHIFDFAGDLYGKRLETAFSAFLRPEIAFGGIDDLVEQMRKDEAQARALLTQRTPTLGAGEKPL